jgi:hypothetical protein
MTVADVLALAGEEPSNTDGTVLHVNGRPAQPDDLVEPGSTVQMTARVSNG